MTIRQLLNDNILGQTTEAEFRWERFHPNTNPKSWREGDTTGSGVLYDLGVHFLDQVLCLFGMPNSINASIRNLRHGAQTDDYFHVSLGYSSGLIIQLNLPCSSVSKAHVMSSMGRKDPIRNMARIPRNRC